MNWKEQIAQYELRFGSHFSIDWKPAIALVKKIILEHGDDVEASIRVIYFLHNILVEEDYSEDEGKTVEVLLKEYFRYSQKQFQGSAEYMFFIGRILHIAEWYFGIDESMKPVDQTLAFRLQKQAAIMESGNMLYTWGYLFSAGDEAASGLAEGLLSNLSIMEWLRSKGYPGQYTIEALKFSSNRNG